MPMSLTYTAHESSQDLLFTSSVLKHFEKHKQFDGPEAGGQLFGILEDGSVVVKRATGPYAADKRKRFLFVPCRNQERKDIKSCFKEGLHYLGDWHTHPEREPSPSGTDLKSMSSCFRESKHEHQSFVMVIVGTADTPQWLSVTLHNAREFITMTPSSSLVA